MEQMHITMGDIALAIIGVLFSIAFGLWAKRLDKALDLLERIQQDMHQWAKDTEHRLTRLEAHVGFIKRQVGVEGGIDK